MALGRLQKRQGQHLGRSRKKRAAAGLFAIRSWTKIVFPLLVEARETHTVSPRSGFAFRESGSRTETEPFLGLRVAKRRRVWRRNRSPALEGRDFHKGNLMTTLISYFFFGGKTLMRSSIPVPRAVAGVPLLTPKMETYKLHPLVLINVSDHHTRFAAQREHGDPTTSEQTVLGCLLGFQTGTREVEICISFEVSSVADAVTGKRNPPYLHHPYLCYDV